MTKTQLKNQSRQHGYSFSQALSYAVSRYYKMQGIIRYNLIPRTINEWMNNRGSLATALMDAVHASFPGGLIDSSSPFIVYSPRIPVPPTPPPPIATQWCRFLEQEVREKRRAFVVLPRIFAPVLRVSRNSEFSKKSTLLSRSSSVFPHPTEKQLPFWFCFF